MKDDDATVSAPPPDSLYALQKTLPWGTNDYNSLFRADARPHRDWKHAIDHVAKAHGRLIDVADAFEHEDPLTVAGRERQGVAKRLADLVICAARAGNTYPGRPIDLGAAVASRLAEKFTTAPGTGGGAALPARVPLADRVRAFFAADAAECEAVSRLEDAREDGTETDALFAAESEARHATSAAKRALLDALEGA